MKLLKKIRQILNKKISKNNYLHSIYTLIHLAFTKGKNGLYLRYSLESKFSRDFVEYILDNKNKDTIKNMIGNLDIEGKKIVEEAKKIYCYIYSHNLLEKEKLKDYISLEKINKINISKQKIILPFKQYEPSVFHYHNGLKYLPDHVISQLKDTNFIDAGAFIGDSAAIFEKYYSPSKIYCFEPEKENYEFIFETIKLNNLKKIVAIKNGLAEKKGSLKLKFKQGASYIDPKGDQIINITTIDDFIKEKNLSNLGLIKMDIEGYELKALEGSKDTIKTHKPVLLISIYHTGKEFFESMNFIKNIEPSYKFLLRKLDPSSFINEITLICWCDK